MDGSGVLLPLRRCVGWCVVVVQVHVRTGFRVRTPYTGCRDAYCRVATCTHAPRCQSVSQHVCRAVSENPYPARHHSSPTGSRHRRHVRDFFRSGCFSYRYGRRSTQLDCPALRANSLYACGLTPSFSDANPALSSQKGLLLPLRRSAAAGQFHSVHGF